MDYQNNNGYQQNGYDQNAYNQQQGYNQQYNYPQGGYQQGGYQYNGYNQQQTPAPSGGTGIGIAAMVCGILSLIFCWIPLMAFEIIAILLALCGVIMGAIGMKNPRCKGMSIAGLVCGIIGFVFAVIFLIACVSAYNSIRYFY